MKIDARWIVAAVILFFSWKGADLNIEWPPADGPKISTPKPSSELMQWAAPVRPILPKMLVKDRLYLASLYEAMAFVLLNDGRRDAPIISDTEKFAAFHASALRLAIEKANVGKYPGLGEAIDQVFASAVPDVQPIDQAVRSRLVAACGTLAWTFGVGRDE